MGTQKNRLKQCSCSRRVRKIVYPAIKKGNILVTILLLKIFFANYFSCVSAEQDLYELSNNRYSARVMPRCDFFPEKRMKGIFVYVLEVMLTLDKMQNTSPLTCTSS